MARLGRAQPFKPLVGNFNHFAATSDVQVALSGQEIATALGSFTVEHTNALTGLEIDAALGTLGVDLQKELSGQEITSALGNLVANLSKELTGQELSSALGNLAVGSNITIALTGLEISISQGTITASGGQLVEFPGLNVYHSGQLRPLSLVGESDAPRGMGGIMKLRLNGVTYSVFLVETDDPNASIVKVRTSTGIKAIRLKS